MVFFVRLWFYFFVLFFFSGCGFGSVFCLVFFALVRLCSLVLCLLSLSGGSGRTTCFFRSVEVCYNFQVVLLVLCLLSFLVVFEIFRLWFFCLVFALFAWLRFW